MPVIIPDEYLHDWLNPNLSKDDILTFCKPYDESLMSAYPINRSIGSRDTTSAEKDIADTLIQVEPASTEIDPSDGTEKKIKAKKMKGDPGQGSLF